MAIRTALLTSRNINKDTDFSKYIETVSEPGVIKGLAVSTTKVAVGQAWVPCERTNGETIYSLVQNCSEATISGSGYVIISIDQSIIDNGGGNEDGTGIATISVVNSLPSKNYLLLAEINNGTVTDRRNMLQTLGEISTQVNSLIDRMTQAEIDIQELEEKGAIDHLEETGLVWEKYTLSNTLFKQATPTLANSTLEANIGDVNANKQIHIQRITSKTASNSLKLKLKKVWAPTTAIVVEVRNATQVDVSSTEAYRYGGGTLICSGTIPYTSLTTEWQEITVNMNGTFWGTQGQLVDIVVYQAGNIVNSTNYYVLGCDSTQYSEAFSYVSVNGETRTRSKLMPYCLADGFAQYLLVKSANVAGGLNTTLSYSASKSGSGSASDTKSYTFTTAYDSVDILVTGSTYYSYPSWGSRSVVVTYKGNTILSLTPGRAESYSHMLTLTNVTANDVITITATINSGWGDQWGGISGNIAISAQSWIIRPLIAKEVKSLGALASAISYGRLNDGSRYGEIGSSTSSTCTAGTIALGNARGFLTVTLNDGSKVKVPYYGL